VPKINVHRTREEISVRHNQFLRIVTEKKLTIRDVAGLIQKSIPTVANYRAGICWIPDYVIEAVKDSPRSAKARKKEFDELYHMFYLSCPEVARILGTTAEKLREYVVGERVPSEGALDHMKECLAEYQKEKGCGI